MSVPLVLQPVGRRSLRSRLSGCDDRDRALTCPRCGWRPEVTLEELDAHVCARRRRPWARVAAAALVPVLAGGAYLARPTAPPADHGPVRALVLSGSSLSYADARTATGMLGWEASVYALPGAGLSRSTLDPAGSLAHEVERLLGAAGEPDVLVVQGGEADHFAPPAVLERAAQALVRAVRATSPDTRLVLVGPIPAGDPPASTAVVNGVLERVAQEQGVAYVDAVARGWRAGDDAVPEALAAELAAARD